MDGKTILPRSEVPEEFTWDLSHVFASDDKWNEELEALKAYPERMAAYAGKLGESAKTLLDWFTLSDEITVRVSKFVQYASCRSDQDVGNSFYQGMRSKAFSMAVTLNSAGAFEASEIMDIPDETLARFYAEEPKLETYRRNIDKLRRRKAHILSPECEKLLAAAGEISESPDRMFSMFHNADMRYPDVTDAKGEVHTLTDGTFVPMLMSADRTLRENAFKAYYKRAGEFRNTYASTLDAQFKQLKFFADARHYNSTLEASLDVTEVPVEVYTNLIDAVHGNLGKMYRYVELRKKILGVDELHMYDVYTPIVADADVEISFEEAKKTALEALAVLGKDYTDGLIAKAKEINAKPSRREMDMLLSTGEQQSVALMAMAISAIGGRAVSLNAAQVGIETTNTYSNARIRHINTERIENELDEGSIVLVTGFQGVNAIGDTTTLGRGGSDTSAVALAAALNADMCEIYTDVEGVYTASTP